MTEVRIIYRGPGATASYLLMDGDTKEAAVVDPSVHGSEIRKAVEAGGLKLSAVILTCAAVRNCAHAGEIASRFGAPVFAPASAVTRLQRLSAEGMRAGLCGIKTPQVRSFVKKGSRIPFGRSGVEVVSEGGGSAVYRWEGRRFGEREERFSFDADKLSAQPISCTRGLRS